VKRPALILLAVFNGYMYLVHIPMLVLEVWS
jgi:hypothetical protein